MMNDNNLLLVPEPKEVHLLGGFFSIPENGFIILRGDNPHELVHAAQRLRQRAGSDLQITASSAGDPAQNAAVMICDPALEMPDQDYVLEVTESGISIRAASPAGVFYGVCTVCQLIEQYAKNIPCVSIKDWPDFPVRGVMLDISRDKVPTLQTLMDLVDLLASWKINHVQLYTEHTFAYRAHETVWKNASPMTGEDIMTLDDFCAQRFVELAPNQNSFGHMERWLKHDEYRHLAEAPDGFNLPWGGRLDFPFSLCPTDPDSIELISSLYDELLPHFRSRLFNVGLDETFDLGQGRSKQECEEKGVGRVYLDFLLKVHKEVKRRGRTMLFWGDIMLHHPELIDELPKDAIALEWGYEAKHPFKEDGEKFKAGCIPFWVCPGTSSWNSTGGRTSNAMDNLTNAAVNGLAGGAVGYLITDWGDGGHWQYLPISYLGFLYGAGVSWNAKPIDSDKLKNALSLYAFSDPTGETGATVYDLGNIYKLIKKESFNCTWLWQQLAHPLSDLSMVDGVSAEEFKKAAKRADDLRGKIRDLRMNRPDARLVQRELINMTRMTRAGAMLGLVRLAEKEGREAPRLKARAARLLERMIAEHEKLWLARNRPGGLEDSKAEIGMRLAELSS